MRSVSPQQEKILEIHRDLQWHCSTEYEFIRDHRARISNLNNGYLKEKGYKLIGEPCLGRCGKNHTAPVFRRKAVKIGDAIENPQETAKRNIAWFVALQCQCGPKCTHNEKMEPSIR